ncbi:type VI secretion system baseplate subunit TssK [Limnoglobus roseus]|uniref:Type VI secretion system baseplate subunit TssK n=1 Tax=Limnoglobus roseus TaxID=2598579 RepID=A0A5C1AKX5_9BACT|nr:type VI secretion system baseplate subunit TssK [Limnoglobus roseus]QEL20039.1 type VI secretion system baseplate subunit TssK [Limnoglobus roseus]
MRTLPVYWHEGMFLRPHHFQASDRFWTDYTRQSSRWDSPYNWGIRRIDIDQNALKTYSFVVHSLQARMRDGAIVRVPQDCNLGEINLRNAFDQQDLVEVLLAVPTLEVGRSNVGGTNEVDKRFRVETDGRVPDENDGKNERPLQFRRLNLALLLTGQDTAGYETLPIARLTRSLQGETAPILDRAFIPPVLATEAWPELRSEILQPIYYKIGAKVRDLGGTVRDREINFHETDSKARLMLEQVHMLNQAASVSRLLARTDGLHPLVAFTELSRLVGQLAIFGPDRSCPELVDYDHDDLANGFFELKRILDQLLNMIGANQEFYQRAFSGHGLQMRVTMDEPWLADKWLMFVGVESNLARGEVISLLTSGQMNMKIASPESVAGVDRVETVYSKGHRGMDFRYVADPPKVLPQTNKDTFFSIARNPDEWPLVQTSRKVAIRLNERLLAGDLEGKREVCLKGVPNKQPILRFTLYVVPKA